MKNNIIATMLSSEHLFSVLYEIPTQITILLVALLFVLSYLSLIRLPTLGKVVQSLLYYDLSQQFSCYSMLPTPWAFNR